MKKLIAITLSIFAFALTGGILSSLHPGANVLSYRNDGTRIIVTVPSGGGGFLPSTNTWIQGLGCPVVIDFGSVGILSDGIHIVGGTNHCLFNGATWTYLAAPPNVVNFAGGAVLSNVWYVSYRIGSGAATNFISWTGGGSTWTVKPSPGNIYHSAWTTYRGKIWRMGSINALGDGTGTNCASYDGTTWTTEAKLPAVVYNSSAGVYNDKIYIVGNYGDGFEGATNVYIYNGSSWSEGAGLPIKSSWGLTVTNNQGQLLHVVSQEQGSYRTNTLSFDGTNWTQIVGLNVARNKLDQQGCNWGGTVYAISGGVTNMEYILPSN
jgi:hypothetical protein